MRAGGGVGIEDRLPKRPRATVVGVRHRERAEGSLKRLLFVGGEGGASINLAELIFQVPIGARKRGTGGVRAGRDVRAGPFMELGQQHFPRGFFGKIAFVKEQVGARRQRSLPLADRRLSQPNRLRIYPGGPQLKTGVVAVREEMDGPPSLARPQKIPDLIESVEASVQKQYAESTLSQHFGEMSRVGDPRVNNRQLP